MVRDTSEIDSDVVPGTSSPNPETTLEALIRAYNRMPLDSDLGVGDLLQWDGTDLVKVDLSTASEDDLLTVQADGTVAPAASGTFPRRFRSGSYYGLPAASVTTRTATNNQVFYTPFVVDKATTFDRIGTEVTGAGNASSTLRFGIYTAGDNGYPDSLVVDAGTVAADSAAAVEATISEALSPGLYWLAAVAQNAASTAPTVRSNSSGGVVPVGTTSLSTAAGVSLAGYFEGGVSGSLPATAGPSQNATSTVIRVVLRAA